MTEEQTVKCIIDLERIFFPKRVTMVRGGEFSIFLANIIEPIENCNDIYKTIKLKGNVCELNYGEKYKVSCKLADINEQYGNTYEIIYINRLVDLKDKVKQRNFLMSILNENVVNKLYENYTDVLSLLENEDIKALSKVKGVNTKSAMRLIEKYQSCKDYSAIYTELGHLGLSSNLIKRLVDYYKSPDVVIETLNRNPYDLVNVDGIGFKKADEIAEKLGIKGSNPNRVKGCILYILSTGGDVGKSFLHYSDLLKQLNDIIGYVEQDIINKVAMDLVDNNEVYVTQNGEYIGLLKYYKLEINLKNELLRIKNSKSIIKIDDIEESILITEEEQGFDFTEEQKEGIMLFSQEQLVALTGGAGCGKSSTAKGMGDAVKQYAIKGTALSGKASLRIAEATGMESSTIHRLLGFENGKFIFNGKNKLLIDVLFIDEATMINGELFLSLLESVPDGAKVVMLGDVQQLTPIGSCQVFADILNSNNMTTHKLTKPHRQAMKSGIIPLSLKIINQEQIFDSTFQGKSILGELQDMELDVYKGDSDANKVVQHFLYHYNRTDNLMETQIITPLRNRGVLSTYSLNLEVQKQVNPISENRKNLIVSLDKERFYTIQIGDKVINKKNNYKAKNSEGEDVAVFNGNMGLVKDIEDGFITIDFAGIGEVIFDSKSSKNLELGYACTVHSAQGSGFDVVIGAIDSSAYILLNAELLYTLITRAKKYCVLYGKNSAIRTAISKREAKNKQTYLTELLAKK